MRKRVPWPSRCWLNMILNKFLCWRKLLMASFCACVLWICKRDVPPMWPFDHFWRGSLSRWHWWVTPLNHFWIHHWLWECVFCVSHSWFTLKYVKYVMLFYPCVLLGLSFNLEAPLYLSHLRIFYNPALFPSFLSISPMLLLLWTYKNSTSCFVT